MQTQDLIHGVLRKYDELCEDDSVPKINDDSWW